MSIIDQIKLFIASFRRVGGIDLPDAGRSSEESLNGQIQTALNLYSSVSPVIDFEMLALLKKLWLFNPDMAQFVTNIQNLANTGHQIVIDATTDAAAENALNRLNETASRIYPNSAGVDGLINAYLAQIAWSGALSSEDVVNLRGRRIEQVVLVPVEQIRFRYDAETGRYLPHQLAQTFTSNRNALGLIPLHEETYRYFALQTVENSPYAKPPASAAVEAIVGSQQPLMENIRYMAAKIGLMGLVTAAVQPPPRKPAETEHEYQRRAQTYLGNVRKALEGNFNKGLLVTFKDQKLEHTNVTSGAQGVYDINRISEEQVMSGLGMQPAFFGRTDSTTETYADVVYSLLTAQVHNIQRLVKRRQEQTYRLDLRLAGIDVNGISIQFNKNHSRNIADEINSAQTQWHTILDQVKNGFLTPTEAAQELGRDAWADEELIGANYSPAQTGQKSQSAERFSFSFDRNAQRYRFIRPELNLAADEKAEMGNVIPLKKKAVHA